jgi:hypothetical protein
VSNERISHFPEFVLISGTARRLGSLYSMELYFLVLYEGWRHGHITKDKCICRLDPCRGDRNDFPGCEYKPASTDPEQEKWQNIKQLWKEPAKR